LIAELSELEPDEQLEVLVILITDVLATILKTDATQVPRSKPINELGVDSLMATEIQLALETKLGLKVAVLEILGDSTIQSLAKSSYASLGLAGVATVAS
jgi:acyl carrier protein